MAVTARKTRLAVAFAGILVGVGSARMSVPMESGALSSGEISWTVLGKSAIPAQAVEPPGAAICSVPPPAELLVLADWPLDPGAGCEGYPQRAAEPEATTTRHAAVPKGQVRRSGETVSEESFFGSTQTASEIFPRIVQRLERAEVPVVERGWVHRMDPVADGEVLVQAVRQPHWPETLAPVMERGWSREAPPQLAASCESSDGAGRCVVRRSELAGLEADASPDMHDEAREPLLIAGARPIGEDTMDGLRGGFVTPGGLTVSFGIERVVYVNGVLSSTTTLNVADLGRLVGGSIEASKALPLGTTVGLIQSGPNNTFVGDVVSSGALATVIQNSLDNQQIRTITTINTQVNSLELMRANRLGETLRDALTFR